MHWDYAIFQAEWHPKLAIAVKEDDVSGDSPKWLWMAGQVKGYVKAF